MPPGAHPDQRPHDGRPAPGDGAEHPLVLTAVGHDHDLVHAPPEVGLDRQAVHVGEGLVEVDVPQVLVDHDQADGAGLEEGVEEGEVGLDAVEFVTAARQDHHHRGAGSGHGEGPEAAVEGRAVTVPGRQPAPPVALRTALFRQPGARCGRATGGIGEEEGAGPGEYGAGLVPEEVTGAGPPEADAVVFVDAEDGHGHALQQRPRLGPDRAVGLLAPRPGRWHETPPSARRPLHIIMRTRRAGTPGVARRPGASAVQGRSPSWAGHRTEIDRHSPDE